MWQVGTIPAYIIAVSRAPAQGRSNSLLVQRDLNLIPVYAVGSVAYRTSSTEKCIGFRCADLRVARCSPENSSETRRRSQSQSRLAYGYITDRSSRQKRSEKEEKRKPGPPHREVRCSSASQYFTVLRTTPAHSHFRIPK